MSRKSLSFVLFPALVLLAAPTLSAQTPERVTLTGPRIAIWNIAGKMNLVPTTGRAVQVSVTRRGSDASRLEVAHGPLGGRETLRVIYPDDDISYPGRENSTRGRWSTELRVRDDGTFSSDYYERRRGESGRRIRVTGNGGGLNAAADLEIQVPAGQEIAIYLAVGEVTARNLDGKILLDTHGADVTATAMKGDLDLDTGSGDIRVDGMEGTLRVDVGSGDVTLSNVKGATLDVDTGSGEVTGTGIASDVLNIDTGSGGVELDGLTAQMVNVDVGSGDIALGWTTDPGDVNIDSGSGDVRLTLPANSGGAVDFESSSGSIDSAFDIQTRRIERDALRGSFGDGRGRLQVETGSGDVSLIRR